MPLQRDGALLLAGAAIVASLAMVAPGAPAAPAPRFAASAHTVAEPAPAPPPHRAAPPAEPEDGDVCGALIDAAGSLVTHTRRALERLHSDSERIAAVLHSVGDVSGAVRRRSDARGAGRSLGAFAGNVSRVVRSCSLGEGGRARVPGLPAHVELRASTKTCPPFYETAAAVLGHVRRDWTEYGSTVRAAVYEPVLRELLRAVPPGHPGFAGRRPRVVVPGSGLSRLAWDISQLGYEVVAVECSSLLYAASVAMMAAGDGGAPGRSSPFPRMEVHLGALSFDHRFSGAADDQFASYTVPDTAAPAQQHAGAPEAGPLQLLLADFNRAFGNLTRGAGDRAEEGSPLLADAVVTSFFIDTGDDVLQYLETIARLLGPSAPAPEREGAPPPVWLNVGPLHYASSARVRLSWAEVRAYALHLGLSPQNEEVVDVAYTERVDARRSMYVERYTVPVTLFVRTK